LEGNVAQLDVELQKQLQNVQQQKGLLDKLKALLDNKTEQLRIKDTDMAAEVRGYIESTYKKVLTLTAGRASGKAPPRSRCHEDGIALFDWPS